MSKLSFRARALDPSKPMPIYMAEELPDLPDFSAINRAVPQMPTGMQKEEECEHHLQRAICAGLIIPTPEVTDVPDFYDKVYPSNYKQPRQLIHMQPFTMEQEIPDYDMDSDDERWLQSQKSRLDLSVLKFEEMMDRLEKSSGQTVITLSEAKALLKEDDELTIAVYDYWLNKRLKLQHPLILSVRTEHRSGTAANNPYLAFRRRTEKMQTRKNRKNDEVSYEKMLKLRRDLVRAVTLLELVKRREKCKREFVHLTVEVFEKRFQARDFSGAVAAASKPARPAFTPIFHNHNQGWVDAEAQVAVHHHHHHHHHKTTIKDEVIGRREKRQYKKRKHKSRNLEGLSSDEDPPGRGAAVSPEPEDEQEEEDDGPFAFRRNRLCFYHKPSAQLGNWPWCSVEENGAGDKRFRFTLTSLSNRKCVGFARRRMGRGGRIILDRVATEEDDFWRGLDYSIVEPKVEPQSPLEMTSSSGIVKSEKLRTESATDGSDNKLTIMKTEDTNNSDDPSDDAVEFLRALRRDWLHFRPKTPPPDFEPPCHLLPADDVTFAEPFQMELEPLDTQPTLILDHSPFVSDVFELLDNRWLDKGPQGPIFEDYVYEKPSDTKWNGSSFTITDAGGEISEQENDVEEIQEEKSSGQVEAGSAATTNGLISQLGFTADVHSLTRSNNKYSLLTSSVVSANNLLEDAQKTRNNNKSGLVMEVT